MSERSDDQQPTSNKQQATTSNNQQQPTTHKATTNNQQPTTNKATPKSVCWSGGQACLRPNSQTTRWSVNQLPTTTASQIFNATPGHPGKREGRGPLYAASTPQRTAQRQAARLLLLFHVPAACRLRVSFSHHRYFRLHIGIHNSSCNPA